MEPPAVDKGPRPGPEVDGRGVEVVAPPVAVPVREHEEQPADLDAAACGEQRRKPAGPQRGKGGIEDIGAVCSGLGG